MAPHGICEQLSQAFHHQDLIDYGSLRRDRRPVRPRGRAACRRPDEQVSGGELRDPGERGQRIGHVPQAEVGRYPAFIEPPGEARQRDERAELGAECDTVGRQPVAQGLDADTVPGQDQALRAGVPQGDREHPAQLDDTILPHLFVEVNDRLGVALRAEAVPAADQVTTQLVVVVDLAVEDDLNRAVFVSDRLLPPGYIDDGEPAHTEGYVWGDEIAAVVRTSMDDRVAHRVYGAAGLLVPELPPSEAGDAAHRPTAPLRSRARATHTRRSGAPGHESRGTRRGRAPAPRRRDSGPARACRRRLAGLPQGRWNRRRG